MNYKMIIPVLALGLLSACSNTEKPKDLTLVKKQNTPDNQFSVVTEKRLSAEIRLPGNLRPFNEVNIFPRANGFVKKINVDRGSVVRKGQLLMTLEAPELAAQLQSAGSRYLQASENAAASKEKYQRLSEAAKEPGAVSMLELDNALSRMKADQAIASSERSNRAAVKTMEGYLNIYAPFDGVITQRNVSPGALVSPGKSGDQPMLVLQDTKKLRLEVYIPENYSDKVDLEKAVHFTFNALPGQIQTARISRSSNTLGALRSEAIEIDVYNPDFLLKPGMYGEVKIPLLSGAKSLLVPNTAIVRSTERAYVIRNNQRKAILTDIREGLASHDSTEVFGNLKPGDKVLKQGNDEIKEGDLLK